MASVRRACQVAAAPFLLLQGPEEGRCHPGRGSPPFWAEPGPPVAAHLRSISGEQASEWWSVDVFSSVPAGRGGAAWAGAGPWVGGAVEPSPGPSPPRRVPRAQGCSRRAPRRQGSWKRLKTGCSCSCAGSAERPALGGRGQVARPRPPAAPLSVTQRAVVEVKVTQEHAEGHDLVPLAALGLKLLHPVQQQRQLFTAHGPVVCGVGVRGGRREEGSVQGAIPHPGHVTTSPPCPVLICEPSQPLHATWGA